MCSTDTHPSYGHRLGASHPLALKLSALVYEYCASCVLRVYIVCVCAFSLCACQSDPASRCQITLGKTGGGCMYPGYDLFPAPPPQFKATNLQLLLGDVAGEQEVRGVADVAVPQEGVQRRGQHQRRQRAGPAAREVEGGQAWHCAVDGGGGLGGGVLNTAFPFWGGFEFAVL